MNRMLKLVSAFATVAALSVVGSALAGNAGGNRATVKIAQTPLGRILVDGKGSRSTTSRPTRGRPASATAPARRSGRRSSPRASRSPGPASARRCSGLRNEGRQARGHLRRSPALLLRHRPQAGPDDRTGRRPVRRPVVGHLGGRKGDPPWLAHPLAHAPATRGAVPRRARPAPRRRRDLTARSPATSAPSRSSSSARSTPSSTTTRTSTSCPRSARSSCSASSERASSASCCSRRSGGSAGGSAT